MFLNKTRKMTTAVVLATFLAGCATAPDKISAAYVSPLLYSRYSCIQIQDELLRVNKKVIELTGIQKKDAANDAVAMGIGMVLFWPALFFIDGNDRSGELARLKGEYDALESSAIQKNCNVAADLREARKQRDAYNKREEVKHKKYQKDLIDL